MSTIKGHVDYYLGIKKKNVLCFVTPEIVLGGEKEAIKGYLYCNVICDKQKKSTHTYTISKWGGNFWKDTCESRRVITLFLPLKFFI